MRYRRTGALSPRMVQAIEREERALALRLEGLTFPEIAAKEGWCSGNAGYSWKLVDRALKRRANEAKDVEKLRAKESARIEVAIQAVWPKVKLGEKDAIDSMLKLMARRARYYGLDIPESLIKFEKNVNVDHSHTAIVYLPDNNRADGPSATIDERDLELIIGGNGSTESAALPDGRNDDGSSGGNGKP